MLSVFKLVEQFLASRATKAAWFVFVGSWLPLYLVILFGEPDSNPIGLGLLAWFGTLVSILLFMAGAIRGFQRWNSGS